MNEGRIAFGNLVLLLDEVLRLNHYADLIYAIEVIRFGQQTVGVQSGLVDLLSVPV